MDILVQPVERMKYECVRQRGDTRCEVTVLTVMGPLLCDANAGSFNAKTTGRIKITRSWDYSRQRIFHRKVIEGIGLAVRCWNCEFIDISMDVHSSSFSGGMRDISFT